MGELQHAPFEALVETAERQAGRSPDAVREDLIRELKAFCGRRRHPDDLTFLVIKYCGSVSSSGASS